MSVRTVAGLMELTFTPQVIKFVAIVRVKWSRAALDMLYDRIPRKNFQYFQRIVNYL